MRDGFFQLVEMREILPKVLLAANIVHETEQSENHIHGVFLGACSVRCRPLEERVEDARLLKRLYNQKALGKVFGVGRVIVENAPLDHHFCKGDHVFSLVDFKEASKKRTENRVLPSYPRKKKWSAVADSRVMIRGASQEANQRSNRCLATIGKTNCRKSALGYRCGSRRTGCRGR